MKSHITIALAAAALISISSWKSLGGDFGKIQQSVRRFFLFIFWISLAIPYFQIAERAKEFLLDKVDFNYLLGKMLGEYKGTDWADGILSMTFIFIYIGIVISLWSAEKKMSKKKDDKKEMEDKPFKIEARIGNIQEEKKDPKK